MAVKTGPPEKLNEEIDAFYIFRTIFDHKNNTKWSKATYWLKALIMQLNPWTHVKARVIEEDFNAWKKIKGSNRKPGHLSGHLLQIPFLEESIGICHTSILLTHI